MNPIKPLVLLLGLSLLNGCSTAPRDSNATHIGERGVVSNYEPAEKADASTKTAGTNEARADEETLVSQNVSLNQADQSQSIGEAAEALNRKIIRNADLTLEVGVPMEAQRKITWVAESLGGFVVTSESRQRESGDPGRQQLEVHLVRIPSPQFGSALDQIRNTGTRVIQEKVSGQDVTEEFIDLEARIKTQKALELQFLGIMRQANKVTDALEVQSRIAEVRTEIEKLEGRKRFLENRASLSSISVSLQTPTPIVATTSGFGRHVREAVADSVDVASSIVLFVIRFLIVMVPILILVILPAGLLTRYAVRRARRMHPSRELKST